MYNKNGNCHNNQFVIRHCATPKSKRKETAKQHNNANISPPNEKAIKEMKVKGDPIIIITVIIIIIIVFESEDGDDDDDDGEKKATEEKRIERIIN